MRALQSHEIVLAPHPATTAGAATSRRALLRRLGLAIATALAAWLCTLAAVLPLAGLVSLAWLPGAATGALIIVSAGAAGYAIRRSALAAPIMAAGTVVFALRVAPRVDDTTIPLPDVIDVALEQIVTSLAPVVAGDELTWVLRVAFVALAALTAALALAGRWIIAAVAVLIAAAVAPQIAVPGLARWWTIAPLVIAIPALIAIAAARARAFGPGRFPLLALAATSAAVSVGAAAILPPALPSADKPLVITSGVGGTVVDTSLDLGDDLRRPVDSELLRASTSASTMPYLRLSVLSTFNGQDWVPDSSGLSPIDSGFRDPRGLADDVARSPATISINVTEMRASELPVPAHTTSVDGVSDAWSVRAATGTVESATANARGAVFTASYSAVEPTLEQARAAVPETAAAADVSESIAATAQRVTADGATAYDKLAILQGWFRGPEFRYSLDTPVASGFDGSSADAIEAFLDVKAGYCVHFASAFAVMARSLGLESRVVVGLLPGTPTRARDDDGNIVYVASTSDLHAWPEVLLDGVGWLRFEPTASLGVPTSLRSAEDPTPSDDTDWVPPDEPEPQTPDGVLEADDLRADDDQSAETSEAVAGRPAVIGLPAVIAVAAALALLALPSIVRSLRRRRRVQRGTPVSIWREAEDLAVDAGAPVSLSDTPRSVADKLTELGADRDAVVRLRTSVEHALFAPETHGGTPETHGGASDATGDIRAVRLSVRTRGGVARLFPASLVPRGVRMRAASSAGASSSRRG